MTEEFFIPEPASWICPAGTSAWLAPLLLEAIESGPPSRQRRLLVASAQMEAVSGPAGVGQH